MSTITISRDKLLAMGRQLNAAYPNGCTPEQFADFLPTVINQGPGAEYGCGWCRSHPECICFSSDRVAAGVP